MNTDTTTLDKPATTADLARQLDTPANESQQAIDSQHVPLLSRDVTDNLQVDWQSVQASFVDEPRQAVQRADELVAFAIKQIAETFARERSTLEAQWDRDGDVSTEDLRVALTKYRSFFHRLLSL
jgi:hypothetical protein